MSQKCQEATLRTIGQRLPQLGNERETKLDARTSPMLFKCYKGCPATEGQPWRRVQSKNG